MDILADTGVLLRLLTPSDQGHAPAWKAVSTLESNGDVFVMAGQNLAEFWAVCTRPASVRGGLGLSLTETTSRLSVLEGMFGVIHETRQSYHLWRRLVTSLAVQGKQVHDARLVAILQSHGVDRILTFNTADFTRYPGLTVLDPRAY
jgi:predicted nucleic acid-binding protein